MILGKSLTEAGGGDGSKKIRKKIDFFFEKQQLCVCLCVLAVVAPKTMIFEKNYIFHDFRLQKTYFCAKIGAEKIDVWSIGH